MKFFSRFFLIILLFISLFNPFFCNAKGQIIILNAPPELKQDIAPKIPLLEQKIPMVIEGLVDKKILKKDSLSYAPPTYESHISLFYDLKFDGKKCEEIKKAAEECLDELHEPFTCTIEKSPSIFHRFIVYRVEQSKWLMDFRQNLKEKLEKVDGLTKADLDFVPHISISQFRYKLNGNNPNEDEHKKITESLQALDAFLSDKVVNVPFKNSDHQNFFAFFELCFSHDGSLYVQYDAQPGVWQKLEKPAREYSPYAQMKDLVLNEPDFQVKITNFSIPELLISLKDNWIKHLAAFSPKKIESYDKKFKISYISIPIPEKKVTDLLSEQLKNLAAKLNGLKEKLKDLAQKLTTLKGTLAGAGAVGGGGGGPVVGATKVDPLNLPVSLKLYASEIYKNDGTINVHITPFPGRQVSKKGDKVYLTVVQGAICAQNFVDGTKAAIVNAANSNLKGSSGIAPAIQKGANGGDQSSGPFHDYVDWVWGKHNSNKCPRGEARIMPSFNIAKQNQAYWIINCVGPSSVPYEDILRKTYQNGLAVAWENGLEAICFCAISTGVFGGDINALTDTALRAVLDFLIQNKPRFREVRFYIFNAQSSFDLYGNKLNALMATYPLSNKQAQFSPEWNVVFQKASMGNNPAPLIYELTIP